MPSHSRHTVMGTVSIATTRACIEVYYNNMYNM